MTMRELARLANVSISTVSKAFRDADDVSADTKKHIFAVAKQYGCYGKFYKGKFSKQVIAIICSEVISNYYIGFVERLQNIIEENGGITVISTDHFSAAKQAELIEYYASYLHVDGIIVFSLRTPVKKGYDIPIVSLFSTTETVVDSVRIDFTIPIRNAVAQLYEYGHKSIAFIGDHLTTKKAEIFENVCRLHADLDIRVIQGKTRFEQCGQEGVRQLLAQRNTCTAIICAYDNIAFGAIKELKNAGFSVPEDFSVIGMDNISFSEYSESSLTSIDTCPDEVCMIVWDLLQKKQNNKFYRSKQDIVITGKLIERGSVSKAKTSRP